MNSVDLRLMPVDTGGMFRNVAAQLKAWGRRILAPILVAGAAASGMAQTVITQNNLLQNGGFDSGDADWFASGGGYYFYNDGTENILSIGWWNGCTFSQDPGVTIQPGWDYVLSLRALVAASPLTGVNLDFADESAGGISLTNRNFSFPDQTGTWRTFSLYVSSNTLAASVGHAIGVVGTLIENPTSQSGWLWTDWVQLAPARPYFTGQPQNTTVYAGATAALSVATIGAVTNTTGVGSAILYQWYKQPGTNPVVGATNATLFFPAVSTTNAGAYYVVATGPFGSSQSSNALLNVQAATPAQYAVAVNPNQTLVDSFDGWGTSLCWWANVIGGYSNRDTFASLAFTTLGLNLVRYNIGGGENPGIANTLQLRAQMPGFEPTNGVWNWNADANQRWMLRRAVALGANHVYAFANSPPWWMTVSGSVTGSTNGTSNNLQTGYETNFAQYLSTVVSNLTLLDGIHFDAVTPVNEPTSSWWVYGGGQEGCHMDASQQNRVVNDLRATLTASRLTTGIGGSEDNDERSTINSVGSYDATGQSNLTLVASHTYGANNPAGLQSLAAALGKPLWVSEYGDGDASGMTMARRIHDDLTQTGARAWTYWQVLDGTSGWAMICNGEDGTTNFWFNEKFYVMWQFSHFIRPGGQFISVGDTNSLAAYDPTNHVLTIVAQNDSAADVTVNYTLNAFSSTGGQVNRWRTSAYETGNPLPPLAISNQQFTAYLAAQSVTTLLISNVYATQPVAWYPLEGNGLDATGNGNNAGLVTNVTFVPGRIGAYAAQFSGNANSYMVIPLSLSNSFTIACWVRTTGTAVAGQWWAGRGIVDGEVPGSTSDFGLALVGNHAGFGIGNPDTTITATNIINDGRWHHLAAAWDCLSGQMQLYVDGALAAGAAGPTGTRAAPPNLRLGSIQAGYSGGFFAGAIDDVQLFGRVLSSAEVLNTMNHPPTLPAVPASTIAAGRTLLFTNLAADVAVPAETLTWSLLGAPAGATISAVNSTNSLLSWRPAMSQAPSTNNFYEVVTDNGTPPFSATQSVSVVVTLPAAPRLANPYWKNHAFVLQLTGDSGPDYILAAATNLNPPVVWRPLATNLSATPPLTWTDTVAGGQAQRFYRVQLGP